MKYTVSGSTVALHYNIIPTKKRREFLDLERMRGEDQNEGGIIG
jgi:hypothetical protein